MLFDLNIDSENAAFTDSPELEVARILREIADRVEAGRIGGKCIDANGNKVGEWALDVPELEEVETDSPDYPS